MADDTYLIELRTEQLLILAQLLEQRINANQDVRIRAAYIGIMRAISSSYGQQVTASDLPLHVCKDDKLNRDRI